MKKDAVINIICPISDKKINENAARISAAATIVLTMLGLYFNSFILITFLSVDFALRAFTSQGNSPVKYITQTIVMTFNIKNKPIDASQKRFAAELGFMLCTSICLFQIFENYFVADIIGFILIFFAFLESAFNFCFGCIIYTYIAFPLFRKE